MEKYYYTVIKKRIYDDGENLIFANVVDVETRQEFSIQTEFPLESLDTDGREALVLTGEFQYEPKINNQQLKVETVSLPFDKNQAFKQLKNIKGVGDIKAKHIYDSFAPFTMELLIDDPERVNNIHALGKTIKHNLHEWLEENKSALIKKRPFLIYGFNDKQATFLANDVYKDVEEFKKHPYYVLDYLRKIPKKDQKDTPRFSFKHLDDIVISKHIQISEEQRIHYAIDYLFKHYLPDHTRNTKFYWKLAVLNLKTKVLSSKVSYTDKELKTILNEHKLLKRINNIEFEHVDIYNQERFIYNFLNNNETYSRQIPNVNTGNITYTDQQQDAIENTINHKISCITGGPGTGKTTTVNGIVKVFYDLFVKTKKNKDDANIFCFAPTGRAAKRVDESITSITDRSVNTLHKLIHSNHLQEKLYKTKQPFIVIDESSMIDTNTLHQFLLHIPKQSQVVLIGDVDQLPPIGYGQIFRDSIDDGFIPTITLETSQRQDEKSKIITLCEDINKNKHIDYSNYSGYDELYINDALNPITDIINLFTDHSALSQGIRIDNQEIPLMDVQIITPFSNPAQINSTFNINQKLQPIINTSFNTLPNNKKYTKFEITYAVDDKVINKENTHYPVYGDEDESFYIANGEIGRIYDIEYVTQKTARAIVEFNTEKDKIKVIYEGSDFKNLDLAYAITTHKAQGSEFSVVVIPINDYHIDFLTKNLIYTAISRAKQKLYIYGSNTIFNKMVMCEEPDRNTYFKTILQNE